MIDLVSYAVNVAFYDILDVHSPRYQAGEFACGFPLRIVLSIVSNCFDHPHGRDTHASGNKSIVPAVTVLYIYTGGKIRTSPYSN